MTMRQNRVGKPLSPRELQIIRLKGAGKPGKQIALELNISTQTVKNHINSLYQKLGIGGEKTPKAIKAILILLERGTLKLEQIPGRVESSYRVYRRKRGVSCCEINW